MFIKGTSSNGFTLVELLIVTGIVTMLSAVTIVSGTFLFNRARATQIAKDFKETKAAWELWKSDTLWYDEMLLPLRYPRESNSPYANESSKINCANEILMSKTDLFTNKSGKPNWRGPYLSEVLHDPFGKEYRYDNDGDSYPNNGITGGVNIVLHFCPSDLPRYQGIIDELDKIIDNSDGRTRGQLRYGVEDGSSGIYFLLDAQ